MGRAAGLNDVLKVGLDKKGALAEVEAIGQFDDRLVMLAPSGACLDVQAFIFESGLLLYVFFDKSIEPTVERNGLRFDTILKSVT